jgi:hypothetical protein
MSENLDGDAVKAELRLLRSMVEDQQDVMDVLGEALLAIAFSVSDPARCRLAATHLDRVITARDAIAGDPLSRSARGLLEDLRDDFLQLEGEPPPKGEPPVRLRLLPGRRGRSRKALMWSSATSASRRRNLYHASARAREIGPSLSMSSTTICTSSCRQASSI